MTIFFHSRLNTCTFSLILLLESMSSFESLPIKGDRNAFYYVAENFIFICLFQQREGTLQISFQYKKESNFCTSVSKIKFLYKRKFQRSKKLKKPKKIRKNEKNRTNMKDQKRTKISSKQGRWIEFELLKNLDHFTNFGV